MMKNYKSDSRIDLSFLLMISIINDINKLILLLRKGLYPYEYMDEWGVLGIRLRKYYCLREKIL